MKKVLLFFTLVLSISTTVFAADAQDPFDLSKTQKKLKELGIPTVLKVDKLEEKAKKLYQEGNYKDAIPALEQYAKQANWLSNLLAAGLEPYYGASYDDKKNVSYEILNPLIPIEGKVNEYRRKLDRAMVMQAECLAKIGKKGEAISLLVRALDLLNMKETEWWARARNDLYKIIDYK